MNVFLSDLFLKVARKLGFELQPKQYITNDFFITTDISITSIMADRLATLIVADSDIDITGPDKAKILSDIAKRYFNVKLKTAVVTALGTGDCLIVPITNGKEYDIDIVENNNFAVINSIGDKLYSVVMKRDEFVKDNKTYARYEYHGLEEINGVSVCRIYRYGYVNDKEVSLQSVKEWENIPTETIIPGVDRLLFGRYKCPTVNRDNINSPQGVPITYGLDTAVQKAKDSYVRFNEEYRRKQTKIFARKDLFTKDSDKGIIIPDKAVYQMVAGDMEGGLPITEFSPDLRYDGLKGGVDFNFKMLELFCGLSAGILTDVQSDLATATAIRASMNNSFAFIGTMRKVIESGTDDLIYAISMLYNANSINGVIGTYSTKYDWDASIMENSTETFNMLLQSYGIGAVSKSEVRGWVMNESTEQAEKMLREIEAVEVIDGIE